MYNVPVIVVCRERRRSRFFSLLYLFDSIRSGIKKRTKSNVLLCTHSACARSTLTLGARGRPGVCSAAGGGAPCTSTDTDRPTPPEMPFAEKRDCRAAGLHLSCVLCTVALLYLYSVAHFLHCVSLCRSNVVVDCVVDHHAARHSSHVTALSLSRQHSRSRHTRLATHM